MKYFSDYKISNLDKIKQKGISLALMGVLFLVPLSSCKQTEKLGSLSSLSTTSNICDDLYYVYDPYMHRIELCIYVDISSYTSENFLNDELYYKILYDNYDIPEYYEISLNEEKVFPKGSFEPVGNEYHYVFYNTEEVALNEKQYNGISTNFDKFGILTHNLEMKNSIRVITLKK